MHTAPCTNNDALPLFSHQVLKLASTTVFVSAKALHIAKTSLSTAGRSSTEPAWIIQRASNIFAKILSRKQIRHTRFGMGQRWQPVSMHPYWECQADFKRILQPFRKTTLHFSSFTVTGYINRTFFVANVWNVMILKSANKKNLVHISVVSFETRIMKRCFTYVSNQYLARAY